MSIPRPVVWTLALMSLLPLAGAAVGAAHIGRFVAGAERSRGRVVELGAVGHDDGRTLFEPGARFTAADGHERTFTSTFATYPPAYDLGWASRSTCSTRRVRPRLRGSTDGCRCGSGR